MTEQNKVEVQDIHLKYTSLGVQEAIAKMQSLLQLIEKINVDMKGLSIPKIKGAKAALQEIQDIAHASETLRAKKGGGLGDSAELLQIKAANAALKNNLALQKELSEERNRTLQSKAYTGELQKGDFNKLKKAGDTEGLKAIQRGLEQAEKSNLKLSAAALKKQQGFRDELTALFKKEVEDKKADLARQRQAASLAARESLNVSLSMARHAANPKATAAQNKELKAYVSKATEHQLKSLENALKGKTLTASYQGNTKAEQGVANARSLIQKRLENLSSARAIPVPPDLVAHIAGLNKEKDKGEAKLLIEQLSREIGKNRKIGASPQTLTELYNRREDAKTAYAKHFAPTSPYQVAKGADETAAKNQFGGLTKSKMQQLSIQQMQEELSASKMRMHPTVEGMRLGSDALRKETEYRDLLKEQLALKVAQAKENKAKKDNEALYNAKGELKKTSDKATINRQIAEEKALARQVSSADIRNATDQKHLQTLSKDLDLQQKIHGFDQKRVSIQEEIASRITDIRKAQSDASKAANKQLAEDKARAANPALYDAKRELAARQGERQIVTNELQKKQLSTPITTANIQAQNSKKTLQHYVKVLDVQDSVHGKTLHSILRRREIATRYEALAEEKKRNANPELYDAKKQLAGRQGEKQVQNNKYQERQLARVVTSTDIQNQGQSDKNQLRSYLKALKLQETVNGRSVPNTLLQREIAERYQTLADDKRKAARLQAQQDRDAADPIGKQIREARRANRDAYPAAALYNVDNTSRRSVIKATKEKNFDTALSTLPSLNIRSINNPAHLEYLQKALKYQMGIAGATQAQFEVNGRNQALVKARLEDLAKEKALRDDNTLASRLRLAQEAKELKRDNVDSISKNQITAAEKARSKAIYDEKKRQAMQRGDFFTPAKIDALAPHENKFAKDTLNFTLATQRHQLSEREIKDLETLIGLLEKKMSLENKKAGSLSTVGNLAVNGPKNDAGMINRMNREQLETEMKIIAYRRDKLALNGKEIEDQNKLLAIAKLRHQQAMLPEKRAMTTEKLFGDGGAHLLGTQAGLMVNYQILSGLQSLFSGAIQSAIELDSAFRNLQAISASTNAEMVQMKLNLINVAQGSKFSASEVGEAAVMLAQAGFSISEISSSMKGVILLAQSTGTALAQSVDVVTSVLSIFNMSASQTETIANQLTEALNRSKLNIQKMALGLQYAGNIADDSGISFEELTAALGAMANAGIRSGSTLGTGLRQMIIELQTPSEKLMKKLNQVGLTLDQVSFRSQGLEGVLQNLRDAGFSSADAFQTFQVRAAAAFSALAGNLSDFEQLKEALGDTEAATVANATQMEALAVQFDHLKSNLGILAAEGLSPVLSLLTALARGMSHLLENTEEGGKGIAIFGSAITGLLLGVAVKWLWQLTKGMWAASGASVVAAITLKAQNIETEKKIALDIAAATTTAEAAAATVLAAEANLAATIASGTATAAQILQAEATVISAEASGVNAEAKLAEAIAIRTVGTAAATTATLLQRLQWVAKANWALVIFAALATGAAFLSLSNESERLNTLLDKTTAKHNEVKAALNETEEALVSVDEQIKKMTERYSILNGSQKETTSMAKDLMKQFEALGLAIDNVATIQIDKLLGKMQEFRMELARVKALQLQDFADTAVAQLEVKRDSAQERLRGNGDGEEATNYTGLTTADEVGAARLAMFGKKHNTLKEGSLNKAVARGANLRTLTEGYPEVREKLAAIMGGLQLTLAEGKTLEPSMFSFRQENRELGKLLSKISSPKTKRLIQEAADRFGSIIKDVDTVATMDAKRESIYNVSEKESYRTLSSALSHDPTNLVGWSEVRNQKFKAEQGKIQENSALSLPSKNKQISDLAKKALAESNAAIEGGQKYLAELTAAEKSEVVLAELEEQIGNAKALQFDYLSVIEAETKKQLAQDIKSKEIELETAKHAVELAQELWSNTTGSIKEGRTYRTLESARRAVELLELKIQTMQDKDNANADKNMQSLKNRQAIDRQKNAADRLKHQKKNDENHDAQALDNRKTEIQDELDAQELRNKRYFEKMRQDDKLFEAKQKSERRQADLAKYTPLTTGAMFDTLNAEDKARAQAAANATGQSQEYSVSGSVQNHFARQAALAGSDTLAKKQLQEKLAYEMGKLAEAKRAKEAVDAEAYNKLLLDRIAAEFQLEETRATAADRTAEENASIKKQQEGDLEILNKKIKIQEELNHDLETEMENRTASVENLKDQLQTILDKLDTIGTAFSAGRESLTSGMSSIFSDWASGVIQNVEDVKDAFEAMGVSILQSMLKVVSDKLATQFTEFLFNAGMKLFNPTGELNLGVSTGGLITPHGVKGYARGGSVGGSSIGRDSIPAMLMPNEYVLKPSAVSAVGTGFLDHLNGITTGSISQGKAALGGSKPMVNNVVTASPPVNVYVVSPDQQQQMGQRDVVVALEDDILRGGRTKQLIRAVITGDI